MPEINSNLPEDFTSRKRKKLCSSKLKVAIDTVWPCQLYLLKNVLFIGNHSRDQQKQKWNLGIASSCLMCLVMSTKLSAKAGCFFHTRLPGSVWRKGFWTMHKHLLNLGRSIASSYQREKMGWGIDNQGERSGLSSWVAIVGSSVGVQFSIRHWTSSGQHLEQIFIVIWVS